MDRRNFIKNSTIAGTAFSVLPTSTLFASHKEKKSSINLGLIGVGERGTAQLSVVLNRKDVKITALCDIDENVLNRAKGMVEKAGQSKPAIYSDGPLDYKNLLGRDDVDAVLICTPWLWHVPQSIDAMRAGIAVGCEVSGATDLQECWDLVNCFEETGTPFMIMENVCYRRDVMAVLNMVRNNLFGEMVHLEGGYQHDLREVKFNDGKQTHGGGVEFGTKGYSEARWRTEHSVHRNGDLYPTHGLGPVAVAINNNRGNRFEYLTSTSSKSRGLHDHIVNHERGGKDHPNANINFALGDIVTTVIKTVKGETITLNHDTNLPRPYSLGFRFQGTKGLWMDLNNSLYIEGVSPSHQWESDETYMKKYDHPLWEKYGNEASGAGHGGMDFFVLHAFIEALKSGEDMPLDVYDCASWKAVTRLSEDSIAQGSKPMTFPDFTRGKWIKRKPIFAFDDRY